MSERKAHTFSMDAPECQMCENYNACKHKRRVMCKYFEPMTSAATAGAAQSAAAPILVQHEYRNVKIAQNTTVTIDLCELKNKMEDDFYKELNCRFSENGA